MNYKRDKLQDKKGNYICRYCGKKECCFMLWSAHSNYCKKMPKIK